MALSTRSATVPESVIGSDADAVSVIKRLFKTRGAEDTFEGMQARLEQSNFCKHV